MINKFLNLITLGGYRNKMPAQNNGSISGRSVTIAMAVVILLLASFSIGTEITLKQAADKTENYTQLSNLYQEARYAVGAEESLERKYRLEPGPEVLARYNEAAKTLVEKLNALKKLDTDETASVNKVLTLHEGYLNSTSNMFAAVDAGDTPRVLAIDADEVDPLFSEIDQLVNTAADQHQKEASQMMADSVRIQNWVFFTTPVVFIIGLTLIYRFWLVLRTYETRLGQANQLAADAQQQMVESIKQSMLDRSRDLNLAIEVGHSVSQVRTLDVMLKDAVELIRSRFDLYYVQIYLTNPSQTALVLQSGTGEVGEELIGRGHSLPLNTDSINGRAAVEKRTVVISDTTHAVVTYRSATGWKSKPISPYILATDNTSSPNFRPNPLLPDTRSEMAIPLIIGEEVVGVLDLQSQHVNALNQEILPAFEALAGQLAIAIQNATFLAETEQAHAEVEAQARRQSRANWDEYLDAIHKPEEIGFVFEKNQIIPIGEAEPDPTQLNVNSLTAPISVTGEAIGNLVVEMEGQSPISRTSELVNTVARQVAQQIESLRLLDSAERFRAEAEQSSRRLTHEGWQDYLQANADEGISFIYDLNEVRPFDQVKDQQAEKSAFILPLKVRNETVGKLVVQGLAPNDNEALDIANAVAERLSAHIEGLRLTKQTEQALATTQQLAQREQALRQITSAVRGSTDPATILRTAARELGTLLGRKTIIRLDTAHNGQASQPNPSPEPIKEVVTNNEIETVAPADQS
jgi:GAF domain-containing protein/CHASE3 domain sensor protein